MQTRISWYMIMKSIEEDDVAQTKGVCNVILCPPKFDPHRWLKGLSIPQLFQIMMDTGSILENLPQRVTSQHFCYSSSGFEFFMRGFRGAFGKHQRLRTRPHFGSNVEIQYSLLSFGISCPFLTDATTTTFSPPSDERHRQNKYTNDDDPRTTNNDVGSYQKMMMHQNFIQRRQEIETKETLEFEQADANGRILYPKPFDVLVGRGCPYQTYKGNVNLSDIVERQFLDDYRHITDKFEKTCIHIDVVKYIQNVVGGRFLERTTEGWKVVDDKVARKKVNSSFRSKMAKLKDAGAGSGAGGGAGRDNGGIKSVLGKKKNHSSPPSSPELEPTPFDDMMLPLQVDTIDSNNRNCGVDSNFIASGRDGIGNKRLRYDPSLLS